MKRQDLVTGRLIATENTQSSWIFLFQKEKKTNIKSIKNGAMAVKKSLEKSINDNGEVVTTTFVYLRCQK